MTAETAETVLIVPASKRDTLALPEVVEALGGAARVDVRDDASVDDGLLDLYAMPPLYAFRLMLKWPSLLRGTQYN